jgi:hypothetical protein
LTLYKKASNDDIFIQHKYQPMAMCQAKNGELLNNKNQVLAWNKNLKNNKAAGVDSIAAELLKNGEANLVDALHEVIQQAWTSETLPKSWTEGILCPW